MIRRGFVLALLALAAPSAAFAYAYTSHDSEAVEDQWPAVPQGSGIPPVTWSAGATDVRFVLGVEGDYAASARSAMAEWTAVEGSRLRFFEENRPAEPCSPDRINVIAWGDAQCGGEGWGDVLGATLLRFEGRGNRWTIVDADVVLDASRAWQPDAPGDLQPGVLDFRRVLLHELGHAIGLEHPDDVGLTVDAVMNSRISNVDSLSFDDREGIAFLYAGDSGGDPNQDGESPGTSVGSGTGGGGGDLLLLLLAGFAAVAQALGRRFPHRHQ